MCDTPSRRLSRHLRKRNIDKEGEAQSQTNGNNSSSIKIFADENLCPPRTPKSSRNAFDNQTKKSALITSPDDFFCSQRLQGCEVYWDSTSPGLSKEDLKQMYRGYEESPVSMTVFQKPKVCPRKNLILKSNVCKDKSNDMVEAELKQLLFKIKGSNSKRLNKEDPAVLSSQQFNVSEIFILPDNCIEEDKKCPPVLRDEKSPSVVDKSSSSDDMFKEDAFIITPTLLLDTKIYLNDNCSSTNGDKYKGKMTKFSVSDFNDDLSDEFAFQATQAFEDAYQTNKNFKSKIVADAKIKETSNNSSINLSRFSRSKSANESTFPKNNLHSFKRSYSSESNSLCRSLKKQFDYLLKESEKILEFECDSFFDGEPAFPDFSSNGFEIKKNENCANSGNYNGQSELHMHSLICDEIKLPKNYNQKGLCMEESKIYALPENSNGALEQITDFNCYEMKNGSSDFVGSFLQDDFFYDKVQSSLCENTGKNSGQDLLFPKCYIYSSDEIKKKKTEALQRRRNKLTNVNKK